MYRLPTEAEWEYAARAGGKSAYPHGATLTPADADFGYNSNATLPVGQFTPNAYGLLDMAGNVWELTQDCWEPSLDSMSEGGSARESGDCERRTMRGGAWYNSPNILRSASRWSNPMLAAGNGVGFRVVREAGPQGRASGESRRQATTAPAGPSDAGTAVRPAAQPVAVSAGTGASATAPAQAAAAPPQATPARGGKNGSNSPQPSSNGRSNGSGASSAQRRGDDTSERPRERAAR